MMETIENLGCGRTDAFIPILLVQDGILYMTLEQMMGGS